MHLTRELTVVVKAEVVSILKGYPAGLKAVQLYSIQWHSFPGQAPSLQEYIWTCCENCRPTARFASAMYLVNFGFGNSVTREKKLKQ